MSVAVLGLAIDSSPAAKAVVDLDALTAAAGKAGVAVEKIGPAATSGLTNAGAGASTLVDKINQVVAEADAASAKVVNVGTSAAVGFTNAGAGASTLVDKIVQVTVEADAAAAAVTNIGSSASVGMDKAAAATNALTVNMSALEKTLAATAADINVQAVAMANGTTATSALSAAHGGLSTQAMAAQHSMRSMVEMLAMGIPPSQILASQMNHLSFAATGPNGISGAFKEAGAAIAGLLSPTTLIVGGLVGLAAAAYLVNSSIVATGKQFDDLAHSAGTTLVQIRALEAAATFKGIDTSEFLTASAKFASNVYDAKNNMGSLGDVLRANGQSATDFAGTFGSVAYIIKRASSDQQRLQLLQQANLPATMDWVRFMSQGADGIKSATDQAGKFSAAEQDMIDKARAFDEAMSEGWKNFKNTWLYGILELKAGIQSIATMASHLGQDLHPNMLGLRLDNAFSDVSSAQNNSMQSALQQRARQMQGGSGNAVDPAAAKAALSLEQQHISLLGQSASIGQQVRLVEIQIAQARLSGVSVTKAEADQLTELARQQALGITALKQQTMSYQVQADTVGMSVGQAAAYAAVQERINAAILAGQKLTPGQIAEYKQAADAMGAAAQKADDLKFEYDTFSGTMKDFETNLRNGQTAWTAFENAGVNALGKIADRLMDMASKQLWNAAFPTGGGGILSLLGLGGGSSTAANGATILPSTAFVGPPVPVGHTGGMANELAGSRYVHPAYFDNAPRFHSGIGAGEMAAVIRTDESVLTPGQMKALAPVSRASQQPAQVTVSPTYTFNNADPSVEARLRLQIAQTAQQTQAATVQAVAQLQRNSPGNYLPKGSS